MGDRAPERDNWETLDTDYDNTLTANSCLLKWAAYYIQ
jgi:hypothetical protein